MRRFCLGLIMALLLSLAIGGAATAETQGVLIQEDGQTVYSNPVDYEQGWVCVVHLDVDSYTIGSGLAHTESTFSTGNGGTSVDVHIFETGGYNDAQMSADCGALHVSPPAFPSKSARGWRVYVGDQLVASNLALKGSNADVEIDFKWCAECFYWGGNDDVKMRAERPFNVLQYADIRFDLP
jgi:hypothetical protein